MTIWLVWLRIEPLPGCKVVPESFDPRLECALPAASPEEVHAALDRALARHRQRVAEIEACVPFREGEWSDANDPDRRVRDAARAARARAAAQFAAFGCPPPAAST